MTQPWFVLTLYEDSDANPIEVTRALRKALPKGAEVFVPAAVTEFRSCVKFDVLWAGYAFVRGVTDKDLHKIVGTKFVDRALTHGGKYSTIPHKDIEHIRSQVQGLTQVSYHPGDRVEVLQGPFKDLFGDVVAILPGPLVQVNVSFRSKQSIFTVPPSFLRLDEGVREPPGSGVLSKEAESKTGVLLNEIRYLVTLPSFSAVDDAGLGFFVALSRYLKLLGFSDRLRLLLGYFGPYINIQDKIQRYLLLKYFVGKFSSLG